MHAAWQMIACCRSEHPDIRPRRRSAIASGALHEPSFIHRRPRFGCLVDTFSSSHRQVRSTRFLFTVQPALRSNAAMKRKRFSEEQIAFCLEAGGQTLGVPLFQEQAMRVAIECAGFTPTEADQLRRSMATFKHTGGVSAFRDKLVNGMVGKGYDKAFAEKTFSQLEGFGSYGFPESHAASFALIAYASSWMKCHHPDVFCAALLNA